MKCTNCSATLSCGCQKRQASDGRQVCGSCIAGYENNLKAMQNLPKAPIPNNTAPQITSITYNQGK